MTNKPNTKCIECGKTYYSIEGDCHKEENERFFETICSNECGKKQGLNDEELESD